jgi:hypothetical protein
MGDAFDDDDCCILIGLVDESQTAPARTNDRRDHASRGIFGTGRAIHNAAPRFGKKPMTAGNPGNSEPPRRQILNKSGYPRPLP